MSDVQCWFAASGSYTVCLAAAQPKMPSGLLPGALLLAMASWEGVVRHAKPVNVTILKLAHQTTTTTCVQKRRIFSSGAVTGVHLRRADHLEVADHRL